MSGESVSGRAALWMRITLVVSLGLNLLILGAVAGAFVARDGDAGPADRLRAARALGPPPFVMALDREARRALVAEAGRSMGRGSNDRRAMRRALETVLAELRSDSFDPAVLTGLLADARDRGAARQEAGAAVLVAHLAQMTPEARRAYADRLERALRRGVRN